MDNITCRATHSCVQNLAPAEDLSLSKPDPSNGDNERS